MGATSEWDRVWADFDARRPEPVPVLPTNLPPRPKLPPARQPASRIPSPRAMLALVPMCAAGWVGVPYATAWDVAKALDGRDTAALARHMDISALQASLRQGLAPATAHAEASPEAHAFLKGMADEIAAAWAHPRALTEVAHARGVAHGAASESLRRSLPTGLTSFEIALQGTVAPMTLRLELSGEGMTPRWQVTGVRLDDRQPIASTTPMRMGSLR